MFDHYNLAWIVASKDVEINSHRDLEICHEEYLTWTDQDLWQVVHDWNMTESEMEEYLVDNR